MIKLYENKIFLGKLSSEMVSFRLLKLLFLSFLKKFDSIVFAEIGLVYYLLQCIFFRAFKT